MKYLVDTCVLSELQRRKPNKEVVSWFKKRFRDSLFFVSTVSIAEIRRGINRLDKYDPRRQRLEVWLDNEILSQYGDLPIAQKWGEIMAEADRAGCPRPPLDAQIVATAIVHGLSVVTRNVRDLTFADAKVVNPWKEE